MISFLLHAIGCFFWCGVWHYAHHWWHTRHEAHYKHQTKREARPVNWRAELFQSGRMSL